MPGSGAGTRVASPWSIVDYVDWSAAMIERCGIVGSIVIGHSYAGMVALALAARHPNLVSALVVADTPGVGEPTTLGRGILGAMADAARDFLLVSIAWPFVAWNAMIHGRNCLALIRQSIATDITPLARVVSAPALIAWSGKSLLLRPSAAKRLAECLPNSELYISPQSVHTWVVSQPEEFASAVVTFLASVVDGRDLKLTAAFKAVSRS
jgi:3-oxoadipate enol-lactonase